MKQAPQISLEEAVAKVKTGDTLLVGGFGMTGNPVHLLHALAETDVRDLTYIANNVSEPGLGGGRLLRNGQLKKAIGSFFTSNREAVAAFTTWADTVSEDARTMLCDAQTSGGLLIAVAPERTDGLLDALRAEHAPAAAVIGEVIAGPAGSLEVVRAAD